MLVCGGRVGGGEYSVKCLCVGRVGGEKSVCVCVCMYMLICVCGYTIQKGS